MDPNVGIAPGNAREPCPDRILDDVGGAFAMGSVGGSACYFLKGFFSSPRGARISGASSLARMNAHRLGGSFAVWGGLFSTFDCTAVYLRQKEDPWNSVGAGAATGAFLAARSGPKQALISGVVGGVLLGMIEGMGIMYNKYYKMMDESMQAGQAIPPGMPMPAGMPPMGMPFPEPLQQQAQAKESSGGWFGWGKKQEAITGGSGSKTEILESFDTPSPPLHSFDYK